MPNLAKSLLLSVASLAIALALAEIAMRLFFPVPSYLYELDERYIKVMRPNAWSLFKHRKENSGEIISVTTNRLGYRGKAPDASKDDLRLVVYGDSFIHGEFSRLPDTFVKRLENLLTGTYGLNVDLFIAGVPGYGPGQLIRRIKDELDIFNPDAILLSIYAGNDYGDLIRKPLFRLDEDGALYDNAFIIDGATRSKFAKKVELFSREKPENQLVLVRVLKQAYWSWQSGRGAHTSTASLPSIPQMIAAREREYKAHALDKNDTVVMGASGYDADIAIAPNSSSALYKIRLMEHVLLEIKNLLYERGVSLAVMVIPSPIDACEGYDIQVDTNVYPEYSRARLSDTVATIALKHEIQVINLFETMHVPECNSLYFHYGDDHWNDLGQSSAASVVADRIISTGFLMR